MNRKRKLGPHQYNLRFPTPSDFDLPPKQRRNGYLGGPYVCLINGRWYTFRSRWKAEWFRKYGNTACISAPTIRELTQRIMKAYDGWKFGGNHI